MQAESSTTTTPRLSLGSVGSWVFSAGERTCTGCRRTIPTRETHFALYPRFAVHYCRECMDRHEPDPEAILETVRTAIARGLYVELAYNGTARVIRPYALSRSNAGSLLVHAIRVDCQEQRTYRVDRMEGAAVVAGTLATTREVA